MTLPWYPDMVQTVDRVWEAVSKLYVVVGVGFSQGYCWPMPSLGGNTEENVNWGEKDVSDPNPAGWGLPQADGDRPQPQYLRENRLSNAVFSVFSRYEPHLSVFSRPGIPETARNSLLFRLFPGGAGRPFLEAVSGRRIETVCNAVFVR
jgi:hypothetical protein